MSVIVGSGTCSPSNCLANMSWACCVFDLSTGSTAPGVGVVTGVMRAPGGGKSKSVSKSDGGSRAIAVWVVSSAIDTRAACVAGSANSRSIGPTAETVVMSILACSGGGGTAAGDGASSISITSIAPTPVSTGRIGVVVGTAGIGSTGFSTVGFGVGGRSATVAGGASGATISSAVFSGASTGSGCGVVIEIAGVSVTSVGAGCWSIGPVCSVCSGAGPSGDSTCSRG